MKTSRSVVPYTVNLLLVVLQLSIEMHIVGKEVGLNFGWIELAKS
jgi:hypothetical protein